MKKTKVLIVDDKPENIISLKGVIAYDPQIEVLAANSGHEALSILLDHDFALTLLDVQMPGMSGIELARLMRGTERCKHIPIIFVTASSGEEKTIFEGYDRGAVDFLTKPLSAHIVRSKVRVFVELDQQRKKLQDQVEELKALKRAAEEASNAKSQFLANMSHEIRTPLAAVLGYADLLSDPEQTYTERQECVSAITRNGKVLIRVIDDILDLSRVEAGRLAVERIKMSLPELIRDLKSGLSPTAKDKGLVLHFYAHDKLPQFINSDPVRMRQILNNAVGNAIKFTQKGEVTVTLTFNRHTHRLEFTVSDTGCGLTAEEAKRIFEPFTQADNTTTRKFGGTGLGLTIAQQFAELLGGSLTLAKSTLGKGGTFIIAIDPGNLDGVPWVQLEETSKPLPAQKTAIDPHKTRLDGVKVLLVEDASDNRLLIGTLLRFAGAEVAFAENGLEGIQKALSQDFDVILMDIQMPVADGYEATSTLRRKDYKRPIIALTAHALREDRDRSLRVGCNDHLTKPINRSVLLNSIAQYAGQVQVPH